MKKIISAILIVSILMCVLICPINVSAYDVPGAMPIMRDIFDQGEEPFNYSENISDMLYAMDMDNRLTYAERLETDYLGTLSDLLTIFEIGRTERYSDEYNSIAQALNIGIDGVLNIYKKDEINDTFNAYYGTDVDLLELPELFANTEYYKAVIYGDYFVFYLPNNGYINIENNALFNAGYDLGGAEYWIYEPMVFYEQYDTMYAITQTETVCGYTFPAVKYIGFKPLSNDIISQYAGSTVTLPYTPQDSGENTAYEIFFDTSNETDVYTNIDMDNDGSADSVHIYETYPSDKEYQTNIEINGQTYSFETGLCWIRRLCVVDLNKSDSAKELLICAGHHSTSCYYMVRYENGTITPMLFNEGSENTFNTQYYAWSDESYSGNVYAPGDGSLTIYGEVMGSYANDRYTEYACGVLTLFGICINDDYIDAPNNTTENTNFEKTDWETGKYEAIATIDDYIYYAGPYYMENGNMDGLYGLRMYNSKTREDVQLINRICRMDIMDNKIFAIGGGVSSGYWDRILVVYDVGSNTCTRITSGIDMDFSMGNSAYSIYNGRIFIGHQTDMNHYEIISFNLKGEDIRVEVPPIETDAISSEIYETFAIINGVEYYYQYTTNSNISVTLNDQEIEFDQPPIIIDDRTLVPLRAIFEAMDCNVEWNGSNQEINVYHDNEQIIQMHIGSNTMWTNVNPDIYLDVPPQIINDRTLVPIRAVSESIGAKVFWHGESKTVDIMYNPPYSGTTIWEYYYRRQNDIINFGYFLDDNPHYADDHSYIYSYDSDYDIDFTVIQYLDAMDDEGFTTQYLKDEEGCKFYIVKNNKYKIEVVIDYLLEHVEIHIEKR